MLLDKLLANLEIQVEPFTYCLLSEGWRLHLPGPSLVMLHFVLEGRGIARDGKGLAVPIAPHSLAVVPQGAEHALEPEGTVRFERRIPCAPAGAEPPPSLVAGTVETAVLVVGCGRVRVRYGESLDLFAHLRDMLVVDLSDAPQVISAFRGIMEEQTRAGPGSDAMKAALMNQCLVHLFRRLCSDPSRPLPWLTVLEDHRLARAVEKILEEPGAPYTVDSLATVASMSRSSFSERFTTAFGFPPMSFVHNVRMQRAARLLQQVEAVSIDAVAQRVGFSSRSHFSRAFKKHYGISPTDQRTQ